MRPGRLTIAIAAAVAVVTASPALYLVIRATDNGGAIDIMTSARTVSLLARTLLLAGSVTVAAVVLGVPLAYWTTRCAMPFRRLFVVLLALPLAIPSYLLALTAIAFAGPHGVLSQTLAPLAEVRPPVASGFLAAFVVLTLSTYPLVFLTVRGALLRFDSSIIDASRTLGASHRETFRRLVVPAIRPATMSGSILVALYVIHDFGAVTLLRYDTFTRAIFVAYQGSLDRQRAAALAVVLMFVALLVAIIGARLRGGAPVARVHGSAPRPVELVRLSRRGAVGAFVACTSVVVAGVILPLAVLLHLIARSSRGIEVRQTMDTMGASIVVALGATIVIVFAAVPVSRILASSRRRVAIAFESVTSIGYALPGLVVALSLVFLATRLAPAIYQTLPVLVIGYLILFLPQATGAIRASFEQVPAALTDASRTLGASRSRTLRTIVAPMVAPGMVAGGALVFLTVLKELPATIILSPPGFRSLAMRVYDASLSARYDQAAFPALVILAVSSIPLAGLLLRERGGAA